MNGVGRLLLQPEDGYQVLDGFVLRVAGQDPAFDTHCGGNAERVAVRDGIVGLDFGGLPDEIIIRRKDLHGKLIEQGDGLPCLGGPDPSLDDVVEFPPVDPGEQRLFVRGGKLTEYIPDSFPPGFPVKEAHKRKAIDYDGWIHDPALFDALPEDHG